MNTRRRKVAKRRATAKSQTALPAQPKASTPAQEGQTEGLTPTRAAQMIHDPHATAAAITSTYQQGFDELSKRFGFNIMDLYHDLSEQTGQVEKGDLSRAEGMLICQAHALQSIFLHFALKGKSQAGLGQIQTIMSVALKAQAQCRATLQTLVEVKYPRQTSFVKQQNVAVNQQVNNELTLGEASPARGETIDSTNGLLGEKEHERLELGTARAPSEVDSEMATVAPINGATHRRGKKQGETKLP